MCQMKRALALKDFLADKLAKNGKSSPGAGRTAKKAKADDRKKESSPTCTAVQLYSTVCSLKAFSELSCATARFRPLIVSRWSAIVYAARTIKQIVAAIERTVRLPLVPFTLHQ
jgi:hypothetical protein